ncbi:MAG: hypothetical protein AAF567_26305 [Actinomycetota bacterium]
MSEDSTIQTALDSAADEAMKLEKSSSAALQDIVNTLSKDPTEDGDANTVVLKSGLLWLNALRGAALQTVTAGKLAEAVLADPVGADSEDGGGTNQL